MLRKDTILFKVAHVSALYALVVQSCFPFGNLFAASPTSTPVFNRLYATANQATSGKDVGIPHQTCVTGTEVNSIPVTTCLATSASLAALAAPYGGPGQSESSGFSLNSMDGSVDQFTGDFSYNIPVMDVEGYPIVLTYNSNVGMTDEASWVGLGWNLNVGSVAREMRGIPDEFDGTDVVTRVYHVKEDDMGGFKQGLVGGVVFKGLINSRKEKMPPIANFSIGTSITLLFGSYLSNYLGNGRTFDFSVGPSIMIGKGAEDSKAYYGLKGGLGISSDTKNGIGTSSSVGFQGTFGENGNSGTAFGSYGLSYGQNYHSRMGLTQRFIGADFSYGMNGEYKRNSGSYSWFPLSLGSSFTCGSVTSVPQYEIKSNYTSSNFVGDISISLSKSPSAKWQFTLGLESQTYSTDQTLVYSNASTRAIKTPAYGYFHLRKRAAYTGSDSPIMDYNRERDVEFSEEMKNLPFSFPTYDVFYVNGMGMSATFRGQRNDVGTYSDHFKKVESDGNTNNVSVGLTLSPPKISIKVGYVHGDDIGDARSGKWSKSGDNFSFGPDDKLYFKAIGEPTPKSNAMLNEVGGEHPARVNLTDDESDLTISQTDELYYNEASTAWSATDLNDANIPDTRANIYRPVLAAELASDNTIKQYNLNAFTGINYTNFDHVDADHKANHIAGVEVQSTNGMRYMYGLPVYSLTQSTVTYSTASTGADSQGLVTVSGSEDTPSNAVSGTMELYDKTTVPAHATAFLLTGVTSADYIDLANDGYSIDDIGDYYKINHTRLYAEEEAFEWRMPLGEKAFFNEGLLATDRDNMATYTFGTKEIWYTHSVESKHLIAEFELEARADGFGADQSGTLNTSKPLQRLKKITLYNRNDRQQNGASAKPLQIVEFIYDYSLCPNNPGTYGAPDSQTGKLTLLEVRVYSGPKSEETALHPYVFTYSSTNPAFHYQNTDRWGNYKPDSDASRPQEYFPSAEQVPGVADVNVSAWKLTTINLPSGSAMDIEYEADSYRYVQNKRAMQLVDVVGYTNYVKWQNIIKTNSTWDGSTNVSKSLHESLSVTQITSLTGIAPGGLIASALTGLISGTLSAVSTLAVLAKPNQIPNNIVIVRLEHPITAANAAEAGTIFRETCLKEDEKASVGQGYLKELYLKNFVVVKGTAVELIQTVAKIRKEPINLAALNYNVVLPPTGVMPPGTSGEYQYGYIVLENVLSSEDSKSPVAMSPVQKTALEFAKLHLTDIVYGSCEDCEGDLTIDRKTFWKGDIYREMAKAAYCKTITENMPSQVRLFDQDNKKLGGNARVKRIVMHDNWQTISLQGGNYESGTDYYWDYDYDRSSYGVAAYEPLTGNDENPFYHWDRYTNKSVSFPDASKYTVMPIGESLFPTPVVGYKTVTLKIGGNKVITENNLGESRATFCTAYEYPTRVLISDLQKVDAKKNSIFKEEVRLFGFSQGYSVITNDFHGKPLDYRVYDKNSTLQARTTYTYKTPGEQVRMIDREGNLTDETVAAEYDVYADSRFVTSTVVSSLLGLNLSWPLAPVPSPVPNGVMPVVSTSYRKVGFFTHVLNKHINYSAVVEKIETESLGSVNTAQDLLYDKESGGVLLSSLTDEYNEPLYSFNYPAHWYYTLFRNPLEQPTAGVSGTTAINEFDAGTALKDQFTVGDVVEITDGTLTKEAYVLAVYGTKLRLILKNGTDFSAFAFNSAVPNGTYTVRLLTSGRKNMLAVMMQSVVTKRKPDLTAATFVFPTDDILEASAVTFRPRTNVLCSSDGKYISVVKGDIVNPFALGLLNNLVVEHSYVPQLERSSTEIQGIRYNGTYTGYYSFYAQNSSDAWVQIDEADHPDTDPTDLQKWRPMGQITTLDEYGRPLENRDQIRVYSSMLYGYNRFNKFIPVAQAVNAQQHEIAYDSFDDYTYYTSIAGYESGHFDFRNAIVGGTAALSALHRHSGLLSLSVDGGETASVTRSVTTSEVCTEPPFEWENSDRQYTVDSCMCVKAFEPVQGRKYLISLWVKGNETNTAGNYTDVSAEVSFSGGGSTVAFYPAGQTLDGWQRIEGTFTISGSATAITVSLKNTSASEDIKVYFDDIRIHPFLAGMTTTVYDPETLLPMATHDGYNFTTFYGYDENLTPVRLRVETINGIQTISESEGSSIKDPKN